MNVVLLGGPGSGKGTLAKQLEEKFGFFPLSPGALYRKEYEAGTDFGIKAHKYWGSGGLCPDEMTNELVKMNVDLFVGANFVFDGYPRRVSQAEYLDSICDVDVVIDLVVGDDVVVDRLIKRGKIEGRTDDTEEVIRNRLYVYHSNNEPIVNYYMLIPNRYNSFYAGGTIAESFDTASRIINSRMNLG